MSQNIVTAFRDGVLRVLLEMAAFLPGVLIMLLVLGFSILLAFLVRFALRRSLSGLEFDRRVQRWGLATTGEWSSLGSPTNLAAHIGFWFVVLVGFLAGLKALRTSVTDMLASGMLAYLPNLLAAGAIFAFGLVIARYLEHTALINAVNMQLQSARLLSLGVKWLVVLFTSTLALQQLRIGGAVLTVSYGIVFGGIVLAIALAVGLGKAVTWEPRRHEQKRAEEEADEIHHM